MSGNRFIPVPESVLKIDGLSAVDCLVAGSIFKRTVIGFKADSYIKSSYITDELNISHDSVTRAIKRLSESGVITLNRTPYGYRFTWILPLGDSDSEDCRTPQKRTRNLRTQTTQDAGSRLRNLRSQTTQLADSISHIDTHRDTQKEINRPPTPQGGVGGGEEFSLLQNQPTRASSNQGTSTQTLQGDTMQENRVAALPNVSAFREPVLRDKAPATLVISTTQRDLAAQVLGAYGDETKLGQICTQEMADKAGFLEYCLNETLKAMKSGKVKGRPFGYLRTVLSNNWCFGDWTDPAQVQLSATIKEAFQEIEPGGLFRLDLSDDEAEEVRRRFLAENFDGMPKHKITGRVLDIAVEVEKERKKK